MRSISLLRDWRPETDPLPSSTSSRAEGRSEVSSSCSTDLSRRNNVEWESVVRKLRFIGLTSRQKTSPNTWRWQQHADWVGTLVPPRAIKNISVELDLLASLTSHPKTSVSYNSWFWGDPEALHPLRDDESLSALAFALHLFDFGCTRAARTQFARELARQPAMREPWFRSLAL